MTSYLVTNKPIKIEITKTTFNLKQLTICPRVIKGEFTFDTDPPKILMTLPFGYGIALPTPGYLAYYCYPKPFHLFMKYFWPFYCKCLQGSAKDWFTKQALEQFTKGYEEGQK